MIVDGWFDWMERDPGPSYKTNGGINGGRGIIPHSAEGYRTEMRRILFDQTTPIRRASWHISVLTDRVIQHYPITAQCWTSGSRFPNNNFLAGETEGIEGEPWNQYQIDAWVRVGRELSALQGWKATRPRDELDETASCMEHNECVRFGSPYTSCPSGRDPWDILIPAINEEEEDDMKPLVAWDVTRKRVYLIGGWGAAHVVFPADAEALAKVYGPPTVALSAETIDAFNTP